MCGCPGIVGLHERDYWCPREFPLGGFCSCGKPYGSLHSCPERPSPLPALDYLIEQYRLTVRPVEGGWMADQTYGALNVIRPTVNEAIRAISAEIEALG